MLVKMTYAVSFIMMHKLFSQLTSVRTSGMDPTAKNVRTSSSRQEGRVSVFRTAISRVNNSGDIRTRAVETELTACPWPLSPQSKLTGEMIG